MTANEAIITLNLIRGGGYKHLDYRRVQMACNVAIESLANQTPIFFGTKVYENFDETTKRLINSIKAFRYCVTQEDCSHCPTSSDCPTNYELQKQALDIIDRLCETIEKGTYTSCVAQAAKQSWHAQNSEYIKRLEEEIERLKYNLNAVLDEAKESEAEYEKVYEQAYNDALANLVDGGASCRLCMAATESNARKEFTDKLLRKATLIRNDLGTEGFVTIDDIYETLKEME